MSLSQLQPFSAPQVQYVPLQPSKDANFLFLKLLNKRARVRLSLGPLNLDVLPGKAHLFAVANSSGWFAAITQSSETARAIICSPLSDLREAFRQSVNSATEELPFIPKRTLDISDAVPNLLAFACGGTRLIVGLTQGGIAVFETSVLFTPGSGGVVPLHTFLSTSSTAPRLILPNPAETPLVAVIRERDASTGTQNVEVMNVETMQLVGGWTGGGTPETMPTTISWSPKGKQLAIGLQSGDIVTFDPSTPFTPKAIFPHPPTSNPQTIISATWLTNSSFHTIYMPMHVDGPDIELLHYVLSLDSKSKISSTTKLVPPCLPFPGLRPPSAFSLVLRNWNPAKFLILIGDSASSDIGAITCTVNTDNSNEEWRNLSLDETTQPTMPLDKNTADTVLVGLELDLTSTEPVSHTDASGAETDAHISPIMYAYASDGTVLGWHLINPQGGLYPGMPSASASPNASNLGGALTTPETTSDAIMMSRAPSAYGDPMATSTPTTSTPTTSAPSGFGFGAQQFGRPAGFGLLQASSPVSAFSSQTGAQPTFGQTSTFGQSTAPALASQPSTTGPGAFAGFASSAPTKFGQPSFGFGSSLPPSSSQQQQSDEMMSDSPSGFGTMSLGESGDAKSTSGFGGRAGIFGPISQTPPQPSNEAAPSSNAFGVIKPATGFGAFANLPRQQPQPTQSEQSTTAAASSAFGKSGFGAASFDKPGFGTTAPAFGKSSFGGAVTSAPASSLTSGGFGAFAQGGPTSFLSAAGPITGKPAWSTGADAGTTAFGGTVASNSFAAGGVRDNTSGSANTFGGKAGTFSSPTAVTAFDSPRTNAPGTSVFDRQPAAANEGSSLSSRMPQSASSTQPFAVNASPSSPPSSPTLPSGPAAAPQPTSPAPASLTGPKSTATSSPFLKPAVGFGAFRTADATKSSSPFFNPPANIGSIAIPTFASGGDLSKLAPAKVDTAAPKFGATSTLGGASTGAFGSPSALGVGAKSAAPISGGFMAFSGTSTGGFGAFAGPKKSFGELLKSGDHDTKTSEKPKATEGAAPTVEEVQDRAKTSNASDSPQRSQTQRDSIAKSQSDPDVAKDGASKPVFSDTPATATSTSSDDKLHPVPDQASPIFQPSSSNVPRASKLDEDSDSEDGGSGRIERVSEEKVVSLESATRAPVSEAPSLASLSLSSLGSSFVDVPGGEQVTGDTEVSEDGSEREEEEGGEVEEVEEEAEEDEEDEDEEDEAEGTPSSPSPTSTSESEAASGDEDQAHSEEKDSTDGIPDALEPLKIPLPETPKPRSPSTTPKPEFRAVKMAPAPDRPNESLQAGSSRDSSTTPPGTPMKSLPQPPTKSPISSPTPAAPSSASLSGIGLGRPSSRPSRSSPLALTPVPLLDGLDDEKTVVKSTPPPSITPSIFVSAPIAKPAFPPKLDATKVTPHHKPASPHSTPTLQSAHAPFERSSILTPGRSSTPPSKPPASLPFTLGMPPDSMAPPPTLPQTRGIPLSVPHAPPSGVSPARPLQPQPGMAPSVPLKEPSREEGMQAECVYLLSILGKELEQLRLLALEVSKKCSTLKQPHFGARSVADLCDPTKWGPADLFQWAKILKLIVEDISEAEEKRRVQLDGVKGVRSDMLKAMTRKEEIVRFERAKSDEDFAKMLKVRGLGPEHLETQSQLRRDIRTMRDRIQKLEDHLQLSKKKLHQLKTGKPGIRAPSLDTISRAYRNIDLAITQQSNLIDSLADRISHIDLSSTPAHTPYGRDSRLPNVPSKGPVNVTPHVAVTTAAALNAERSAQRLKRALLALRKEPLLNTTASSTATSAALTAVGKGIAIVQTSERSLTLPPLDPGDSPTSAFKARRQAGTKLHSKPIPLKKAPGIPPPTSTAAFDWGPLPSVAPMTTISSDVRAGKNH